MKRIVLVLRSGGDFQFRDVELIVNHILGKWESKQLPEIYLLWDKASNSYDLGNIKIIPLNNNYPGTWARMQLYAPEMEKLRPFLYIDLDTAIITSVECIFDLIQNEFYFICLEDFWQKNQLATGLVWFPANSKKVEAVWKAWELTSVRGNRMDIFLRQHIIPDLFWQNIKSNGIVDFKPHSRKLLEDVPENTNLVCFHGKPRIFDTDIKWVKDYIMYDKCLSQVTVIIPYKEDRGWLKEALNSIPMGVEVMVQKGNGNWPVQFNKALTRVKTKYVKYLHEDDMLTPNSIIDSVKTFETHDIDFMHGNAYEFPNEDLSKLKPFVPSIKNPTLDQMLQKNYLHSATLMYRTEVFKKVGGFDETLNTAEEYEFNLRCLKNGFKLGYCASFLAYYRRHSGQKVRTVPVEEKNKEREKVREIYK